MFNGLGFTRGLSFVKIIGGLSKTLQVANQIIPLYQKAKPAIQNARSMLGILKEMKKPDGTKSNNQVEQNLNSIENTNTNNIEKNKEKAAPSPTFFL